MLIAGVNIPDQKRLDIALTYIFGIGRFTAAKICNTVNIDVAIRVKDLTSQQIVSINNAVRLYDVDSNLRNKIAMNIKKLCDISCYRGIRHKKGLPVNGQRTHTNAKTSKKLLKKYSNKR